MGNGKGPVRHEAVPQQQCLNFSDGDVCVNVIPDKTGFKVQGANGRPVPVNIEVDFSPKDLKDLKPEDGKGGAVTLPFIRGIGAGSKAGFAKQSLFVLTKTNPSADVDPPDPKLTVAGEQKSCFADAFSSLCLHVVAEAGLYKVFATNGTKEPVNLDVNFTVTNLKVEDDSGTSVAIPTARTVPGTADKSKPGKQSFFNLKKIDPKKPSSYTSSMAESPVTACGSNQFSGVCIKVVPDKSDYKVVATNKTPDFVNLQKIKFDLTNLKAEDGKTAVSFPVDRVVTGNPDLSTAPPEQSLFVLKRVDPKQTASYGLSFAGLNFGDPGATHTLGTLYSLPFETGPFVCTQGFNDLPGGTHKPPRQHAADLGLPTGTKVIASRAGRVVEKGSDPLGGNFVRVLHDDRTYSSYGHLTSDKVTLGNKVNEGDHIATSGDTPKGKVKAHLHFEIMKGDTGGDRGFSSVDWRFKGQPGAGGKPVPITPQKDHRYEKTPTGAKDIPP